MPENESKNILIIGYGNPDREDDGVAWHILTGITARLGRKIPSDYLEGFPESEQNPVLFFELQLVPENAEMIAASDLVIFVDAHTGNIPDDLLVKQLSPVFQKSPFTHHLTPESCLAMAGAVYGKTPEAFLVTVHGFEFGFSLELSPKTAELSQLAVDQIMDILIEYL